MSRMSLPRRPPFLAWFVVLPLALGACAQGAPTPSPAGPSAGVASPSSASPSAGVASPVPGTPGAPTPVPTTPAAAYSCAYPLGLAGAPANVALTAVRLARHDETQPPFERLVFEFAGAAVPSIEVDRASPPFALDGSGLPLDVPGSSFLRVVLRGASGAGSYAGPTAFDPRDGLVTAVRRSGDFEGVVGWVVGSPAPLCARIQALTGPTRLVVDLVAE